MAHNRKRRAFFRNRGKAPAISVKGHMGLREFLEMVRLGFIRAGRH